MGERGEPCGVPWEIVIGSEVCPLKVIRRVRSVRNEHNQAQVEGGKPRLAVMWIKRST
jgi:hypothetical protein